MGVEKFNDRVMKVNIIIRDVVWEGASCYCPQAGNSVDLKDECYELMDKFVTGGKVLVGDGFNGHVSCDMGGFGELHRGFGIGLINDGEIRLMDWTAGKGLGWMNTVSKHLDWVKLKQ